MPNLPNTRQNAGKGYRVIPHRKYDYPDMRAGAERLLAHVVHSLGNARAHHGYLFANARASRIKLLVHDGFGVWCAARRLNTGRFIWPREIDATPLALTQAQFDALVVGLPWQRLPEMNVITRL